MDTPTVCSPQPDALQSGSPESSSSSSSPSSSLQSNSAFVLDQTLHQASSVPATAIPTRLAQAKSQAKSQNQFRSNLPHPQRLQYQPLQPIRSWIDRLEVRNVKTARRIAKLIPAQCPFERDITLLGRTVAHIPPLCKLNPLYDQFVTLRFRALCYLADECGEDIRSYC
jgi:hypothetical protein